MIYVKDILKFTQTEKPDIVSLDAPITRALKKLYNSKNGALLVIKKDHIQGILTLSDCAKVIGKEDVTVGKLQVKDLMTPSVYYVTPQSSLDECMSLMTSKSIRTVPVLVNGHFISFINIQTVFKALVSDRDFLIEQLFKYITGSYAFLKADKDSLTLAEEYKFKKIENYIEPPKEPQLKIV